MGRRSGHKKGKAVVTVSVIGLGKLGSCYAAFYAKRGFNVVGTDLDGKKVSAMNDGRAPVEETDLQSYINANKVRLKAARTTIEAVRASEATFIVVPTPSKKDGSYSLEPTVAVCTDIGKALKNKTGYHLITLVSTVLPEDCRTYAIPAIERASSKKCGEDFGFCYSPSLIAIGDVLANLERPDFLFLGASDKKSEERLAKIYAQLYPNLTPERMSIESVELSKIALNSYVTMKITFANTLGQLCEKIPHANVDHVTTALGKDKRIGSHYIKSGLGFGGPCFPRDNSAFAQMASRRGIQTPLAQATDEFNKSMPKRIGATLEKIAQTHDTERIGFLGVSYKPKTTLTEDSQALLIAQDMLRRGFRLAIFEPLGTNEARGHFGAKALYPETLEDVLAWCDVIFISNRDDVFRDIPTLVRGKKKIIVDPWGMFKASDFTPDVTYHALGRKNDLQ